MKQLDKKLVIIICSIILLVTVILVIVINLPDSDQPSGAFDTTPRITRPPVPDTLTPLQRTEVGKTTQDEFEKNTVVLSTRTEGPKTIYEVRSDTFGENDEVIVEDNLVISERVNTFNKKAGAPPRSLSYTRIYGEPEEKMYAVSPLGRHITAYLYPSDGFALFVNENTGTVYQIHRFEPISLEDYKKVYASYIQPAPEYPKEGR